ncbi:GGDEF domain-containing protein [Embleya hyalina]|uniref:GGDEF domain-containing protein n=1 Tax=Embleya hyalina TaxID=516124 RepID=A0A401YYN1_9ACTN|nr:GGDEF domain-containing protein [Embleya hyalina]GCD99746.1 GGDEF domain-containing protein [Embleya hyalina]
MPTPTPQRQLSRTLLLTAAVVPLALAVADDVRLRRRLEVAGRDELTGLRRRQALTDHGEKLLPAGHRADDVLVLLLDVDAFKQVNDVFGHAAGDRVLVVVARRLHRWCSARRGLAARLGGDEFGAFVRLPRADVDRELVDLRSRLNEPVAYEGLGPGVPCSVSVGAAHTADLPGRPWTALLRAADVAMYRVKSGEAAFPYLGTRDDAATATVNGRRPGRPGTHLAAAHAA